MHRIAEAWIPTELSRFKMITYSHDTDDRMPNIVFIHENADISKPIYVRIHSECLTGDLFGSLRCDCGPQLKKSKENYRDWETDRKSTRLNSSHSAKSRMPSSA